MACCFCNGAVLVRSSSSPERLLVMMEMQLRLWWCSEKMENGSDVEVLLLRSGAQR